MIAAVLDVEEAKVEGYEELNLVGAVRNAASRGTAGGEALELSGPDLEYRHCRSPRSVKA